MQQLLDKVDRCIRGGKRGSLFPPGILFLILFIGCAALCAAEETRETVRIGTFAEQPRFSAKSARLPRYTKAYMNRISELNGWIPEETLTEGTPGLDLLRAGKIDILCGVFRTKEHLKHFLIPNQSAGEVRILLFARENDKTYVGKRPGEWPRGRVGYVSGALENRTDFEAFARRNMFRYDALVRYDSRAEALEALRRGEIDLAVLVTLLNPEGVKPVAECGRRRFYFAVAKDRKDLFRKLSSAIERIKIDEQAFLNRIAREHLDLPLEKSKNRKTVRVACYPEPRLCEIDENGIPAGYSMEYLKKIAEKNNWNPDYIFVPYQSALNALAEGKVDLAAAVLYSGETEKRVEYSKHPLGSCRPLLLTRTDSPLAPERPAEWKGMTVGCLRGSGIREELMRRLNAEGVRDVVIRPFDTTEEAMEALDAKQCGAVLSLGVPSGTNRKILMALRPFFLYLCTAKGNEEIRRGADRAVERIKLEDPEYETRLTNKYYPAGPRDSIHFSPAEQAYIRSRGKENPIRVELSPARPPIKGYDAGTGKPTGFTRTFFDMLAARTGLRFEFYSPSSSEIARKRLLSGAADVWASYAGNAEPLESGGSSIENIQIPRVRIYRKNHKGNPENIKIAVPREDYRLRMIPTSPGETLVPYDTPEACYAAVKAGKADFTIDSLYAAQYNIMINPDYEPLILRYMDANRYYYPYTLIYSQRTNPNLRTVIDKCIANLSPEDIGSMLYESTVSEMQLPFITPTGILLLIAGILVAALSAILFFVLRGRRIARRMLRSLNLANRNKERSLRRSELAGNCLEVLMSSRTPDLAFQKICQQLAEALDMDECAIFRHEDGKQRENLPPVASYVRPDSGKSRNASSGEEESGGAPNLPHIQEGGLTAETDGDGTRIVRTLTVDGKIWGHLAMRSSEPVEFSEDDRNLLEIFIRPLEIYLNGCETTRKLNAATAIRETIFKASPIALMMFDTDHKLIMLNDKAAEITGKTKEEVIALPCYQSFCRKTEIPEDCPVAFTLRTGQVYSLRQNLYDRTYDVTTVPLFENGKLINVIQSLVDQTDLVRSEPHFRETSELLSAILSTMPCVAFVKDYDNGNRYLMTSEFMNRLFGRTGDGLLGATDSELFGPEQGLELQKTDDLVMRTGDWSGDVYIHISGERKCYHAVKTRILREDGKHLLLGVSMDITETILRKEELEKSRNDLQEAAEHLKILLSQSTRLRGCLEKLALSSDMDAVMREVLDEAGGLLSARICRLVAYSNDTSLSCLYSWSDTPEEDGASSFESIIVEKPFIDYMSTHGYLSHTLGDRKLHPKLETILDAYLRSARSTQMEMAAIYLNGKIWGHLSAYRNTEIPFSAEDLTLMQENARVIEIALLRRQLMGEITDKQKKLLEALKEAQQATRAKSLFLATMSHEIRTPLNAVIGFSEFLNRPDLTPDETRDYTDGISRSAHALLNLINDILDLSKLESEDLDLRSGECDMAALADEMNTIFRYTALKKEIRLIPEIDRSSIPPLRLNEQRIRQILLNLIGNSVKFTERGHVRFRISFHPNPNWNGIGDLEIIVEDTGIGIDEKFRKTIFDPFVQETTRGQKVYEGTGLGLPIVKRMVEKLGGEISFESRIDHGTTFRIRIGGVAIVRETPPQPATANDPEAIPENLRILLVDDVPINLKILELHLKRLKASCTPVLSVKAALEHLKDHPADLVLTDLWMPEQSGVDLVRAIRGNPALRDLPVILITADTDAQNNFDVAQFSGILHKPITPDRIRSCIFEALRKSGA